MNDNPPFTNPSLQSSDSSSEEIFPPVLVPQQSLSRSHHNNRNNPPAFNPLRVPLNFFTVPQARKSRLCLPGQNTAVGRIYQAVELLGSSVGVEDDRLSAGVDDDLDALEVGRQFGGVDQELTVRVQRVKFPDGLLVVEQWDFGIVAVAGLVVGREVVEAQEQGWLKKP
ncbi:hypothetical protein AYO22_01160 [Fonsecaea multimorphosa]|nr:hypothetical protein AYO22_01160 [Fonsecaea multimorphosa]